MRTNISFIVTVFVTLLFVSSTVGCRMNDGPWYNPKSYAFSNPFAKRIEVGRDNLAPPFNSTDALAGNNKPSADSRPNIEPPPGGYSSDGTLISRAENPSHQPPAAWGTQSPIAAQGNTNPLGGFSIPEPTQYSPYNTDHFAGSGGVPPTQQYMPHQGQFGSSPHDQFSSHGSVLQANNPMPNTIHQTSLHQSNIQQPMYAPMGMEQPVQQYDPFNAMPPTQDPYAGVQQQQGIFPGTAYEQQIAPQQMMPASSLQSQGFHNPGVGAAPQQYHQPQPFQPQNHNQSIW